MRGQGFILQTQCFLSFCEDRLCHSNRVDPDKMAHNAAFHLGLHCLQKYSFRGSGLQLLYVL